MNCQKSINVYAEIFTVKKELSEHKNWVVKETFWKRIWCSVKTTNIKSKLQYRFITRWIPDFPCEFVVKLFDKTFTPLFTPIIDKNNDFIMFFAAPKEGRTS